MLTSIGLVYVPRYLCSTTVGIIEIQNGLVLLRSSCMLGSFFGNFIFPHIYREC